MIFSVSDLLPLVVPTEKSFRGAPVFSWFTFIAVNLPFSKNEKEVKKHFEDLKTSKVE